MKKEKKTIDEKIRKRIWREFSKKVQRQLHEIVSPVTTTKDRSYQTLTDVISNVILFEINIDKMPWELIPQRKVKKLDRDEIIKETLGKATNEEIARELKEEILEELLEELPREKYQFFSIYTKDNAYNLNTDRPEEDRSGWFCIPSKEYIPEWYPKNALVKRHLDEALPPPSYWVDPEYEKITYENGLENDYNLALKEIKNLIKAKLKQLEI